MQNTQNFEHPETPPLANEGLVALAESDSSFRQRVVDLLPSWQTLELGVKAVSSALVHNKVTGPLHDVVMDEVYAYGRVSTAGVVGGLAVNTYDRVKSRVKPATEA